MNIYVLIIGLIIIFLVVVIGIGTGVFFWFKTRKKKKTWLAKCYQKSYGTIEHSKTLKLNDLIPYCLDRVERLEYNDGRIMYRLISLGIPIKEVTAEAVENWGTSKEVSVLIEEGQATIIKKGYDDEIGKMIFKPMPTSTMQTVINQMFMKRNRVQQDKNLLASIMPYVTIALALVALMSCAYFIGDSFVKTSVTNAESNERIADKYLSAVEKLETYYNNTKSSVGKVYLNEPEKEKIPVIE